MSLGSAETDDDERVTWRIEEMLEAAERNGMSKKGLTRARKMVTERFRSIWATTLTPQDYANVPPMRIEIKGDVFQLPKPYMRRYTAAEIKWWREKMAELVKAGIFRPTNSGTVQLG